MQKKRDWKYWLKLQLGIWMITIGVYFFKVPNRFATGGVSGISVLLAQLFPQFTQAEYSAVINVLLLILGVVVLGKQVGGVTILCTLEYTALNYCLEKLIPISKPLTNEPLLELIYAMFLSGIGSAMLFDCDASSGGTDIVALILKKHSSLDVGRALMATDAVVAFSNFFISGVGPGLYSVLGLFAKTFMVDGVIESLNLCKAFTIITDKPQEISYFIMKKLNRGVTSYRAEGGFTGADKTVLLAVCRRMDAVRLRRYVKQVDPNAFIIITNSSEIIGRGFREA